MAKINAIVMPDGTEFDESCFVAEYGTTTYQEITQALYDGKSVFCRYNDKTLIFQHKDDEDDFYLFVLPTSYMSTFAYCHPNNAWTNDASYNVATAPYVNSVGQAWYLTVCQSYSTDYIHRSNINFGNSTTQYLSNKGTWENVPTVPTNVSSLNNDAGYLTLSTLPIYNGGVS